MRRQDFDYYLPPELIAHYPAAERRDSRLLVMEGRDGNVQHKRFPDIAQLVQAGDLLVLNNTKVIPARLYAHKASGGKVEILVERLLGKGAMLAHVKASKSPKPGSDLLLENGLTLQVAARRDALFELRLDAGHDMLALLEGIGHMPLPPYIDRPDETEDKARYQTVYGVHEGAVAAPTAGLHFDEQMLADLQARGVQLAYVTLHIGAGTFQPLRVDDIDKHTMHAEFMRVSAELCEQVKRTKAAGRRVVAVGTTSVRSLETAALHAGENECIAPFEGDTDIFLYPGKTFRVVDALLTNFHLPESTLMMLVSAFAGHSRIMAAYEQAVNERYRFFSYGDAMFLTRNPAALDDLP